MIILLFGKPLVFWLGLITLISFICQITLGYLLSHGRSDLFKYHKITRFNLQLSKTQTHKQTQTFLIQQLQQKQLQQKHITYQLLILLLIQTR